MKLSSFEEFKKINLRTILFGIIGVVIGVIILNRIIRSFIIEPIIFVYLTIRLFLNQFHQQNLWTIFIYLAIFLILWIALRELKVPDDTNDEELLKTQTQLEDWIKKIENASLSEIFKYTLVKDLENLSIEIIAFKQQAPKKEIRKKVFRGEIKLSESFNILNPFVRANTIFDNITNSIRKIQRRPKITISEIDKMIIELENQLEETA